MALALGIASAGQAAHTEEEALAKAQAATYNVVTGNWDAQVEKSPMEVAKDFKRHMPSLDYHLVEERIKDRDRIVQTYRGEGDQRVLVKLKDMGRETNVRIRVGLLGSEAKSMQLFTYIYQRM